MSRRRNGLSPTMRAPMARSAGAAGTGRQPVPHESDAVGFGLLFPYQGASATRHDERSYGLDL